MAPSLPESVPSYTFFKEPYPDTAQTRSWILENKGQMGEGAGNYYYIGSPFSIALGTDWLAYLTVQDSGRDRVEGTLVRIDFVDCLRTEPIGVCPGNGVFHYLVGDDPEGWTTDIEGYHTVRYENLWDGIDLSYTLTEQGPKYEFVLWPGSSPCDISMHVTGHQGMDLTSDGSLRISTPMTDLIDTGLSIFYQDEPDVLIPGTFSITADETYGFTLGEYDERRTIVIDPLVYSTFLGGSRDDEARDHCTGSDGCVYVTGWTMSLNFPTSPGAFQGSFKGHHTAFVTKLRSDGSSFVYSTFLGGSDKDEGLEVAVGDNGTAYVVGMTSSGNFPTTLGALQRYNTSGRDLFITHLSANGSGLQYSTYLGGNGNDWFGGMDLDDSGCVYVTGRTESTDWRVTSPGFGMNRTQWERWDVFVSKLNASGTGLEHSITIRGDWYQCGFDVAVDDDGCPFVCGSTLSDEFPSTPGAYKTDTGYPQRCPFILKLSRDLTNLEYSTLLEAGWGNEAYAIDTDEQGNAYVVGMTYVGTIKTTRGAYQEVSAGDMEGFLVKMNPQGSRMVYSTYIGGSNQDKPTSVHVDADGKAYVSGYTWSNDFPLTPDHIMNRSTDRGSDGYLQVFNKAGSDLVFSTLIGGTDADRCNDTDLDPSGNIILSGITESTDFPTTPGAFQRSMTRKAGFVVKILFGDAFLPPVDVAEGPRLYAGLRAYTFRVDANPARLPERPGSVRLVLDPGSTDVSLQCSRLGGPMQFTELDDPNDYVWIDDGSGVEDDPANNTYWVDFKILFNWSWPHEDLCKAIVKPIWPPPHSEHQYLSEWLFSIENDLTFTGPHGIRGDVQGPLVEGDWVRAGENVTVHGPEVVYEGTTDIAPPNDTCRVELIDNDGDRSSSPMISGVPLNVTLQVDDLTDEGETLTLTMNDLPEGAQVTGNRTISIRVDGDVPEFIDVEPDVDGWSSSSIVLVKVTCGDRNASGVDGTTLQYTISMDGMVSSSDWSSQGLTINTGEGTIVGAVEVPLPDGEDNYVRWRVRDDVSNPYAVSQWYRLRVDTEGVRFRDPVPDQDAWSKNSTVVCGMTIEDSHGAGIDVSTVQFRISPLTMTQYGEWVDWDEGEQVDGPTLIIRMGVDLPVASITYIQWRATDLAGNGPSLSPHYRVRVDVDNVRFHDFEPAIEGYIGTSSILVSIGVTDDPEGSGVNMSSIEYCVYQGDGTPTEWTTVGMDGTSHDSRFSLTATFPDGTDNHIMFRGWDVAGNGPALSDEYSLSVDTEPPVHRNLSHVQLYIEGPDRLLVGIEIRDDGSGLDTSSVQYRHRQYGEPYGMEWTDAELHPLGAWYYVEITLALDPSKDHQVAFRASDMVGHEVTFETGHLEMNEPPVAVIRDLPTETKLRDGRPFELDGSDSTDPDGDELAYQWEVWSDGTIVDQMEGVSATFTLETGEYLIRLNVSDDNFNGTDEIEVTVEPGPDSKPSSGWLDSTYLAVIALLCIIGFTGVVVWLMRYRGTKQG